LASDLHSADDLPATFLVMLAHSPSTHYGPLLFGCANLCGYSLVLRKIIPRTETFWPALAFPGAFANLMNGQKRPPRIFLAGRRAANARKQPNPGRCVFWSLSYKPPMGVLVPIVLAASGRWRAFSLLRSLQSSLPGISLVNVRGRNLASLLQHAWIYAALRP